MGVIYHEDGVVVERRAGEPLPARFCFERPSPLSRISHERAADR
jgi:hypothetical protein